MEAEHDDVTVRHLEEGDEHAVLELLQESFPAWPAVRVSVPPIEHLRWKLQPKTAEEPKHVVAVVSGQVRGAILVWRRAATLRGREILVSEGSDISVHPAFRGRGLLRAMRAATEADDPNKTAFFLEASTHPAVTAKRERWERGIFGNQLVRFLRPLTPGAALEVFRVRATRSPPKLVRAGWRLAAWARDHLRSGVRDTRGGIVVTSAGAFDERVDTVCEQASRSFDFVLKRDGAYLSWRYADRRGGDFTILTAEVNGELLGYAVFGAGASREEGVVADVLALPGREDAVRALLASGLRLMRNAGADTVECWLPERHPYRRVLEEHGFVLRRRKEVSAYRDLGVVPSEELAFLADRDARMHITLGDTDRV